MQCTYAMHQIGIERDAESRILAFDTASLRHFETDRGYPILQEE